MNNDIVTTDDIHALRKDIDSVIKKSQNHRDKIGRSFGGREMSLVVTKLQEAKMWAGKALGEMGSELPEEFRDEA